TPLQPGSLGQSPWKVKATLHPAPNPGSDTGPNHCTSPQSRNSCRNLWGGRIVPDAPVFDENSPAHRSRPKEYPAQASVAFSTTPPPQLPVPFPQASKCPSVCPG